MIDLEAVTVTYTDASVPAIADVHLTIGEGVLVVVAGATGSGKSTLLGAMVGLVPHFTGGRLDGHVRIDGRDTRTHPPRELADVIGYVGQDPLAGFVTDRVEDELAYSMEQLAIPPATMRKRVEETLDLLGIAELRDRSMRTLSGGQQQRVAIGAALTAHPRVLVLDEPTSALDPTAAEDVLSVLTRLVHDLGLTVVIAEHRLERVVQYADRAIHVHDGGVVDGPTVDVIQTMERVPPIVELARLAGWDPPPLSVRDARRLAPALRNRLDEPTADGPAVTGNGRTTTEPPAAALVASHVSVTYGETVAVREASLTLERGTVTALMGRNGSGKSSLLWALQGSGRRRAGTVAVSGRDPATLDPRVARGLVGLVPQSPADLLYLGTVDAECRQADIETASPAGTCRAWLDRIAPGIDGTRHPRDLSEGQRLALVLAIQLAPSPGLILLDEPTRGLDYHAKTNLAAGIRSLALDDRSILLATHDVEFAALVSDRVLVMAQGEIVADGPAREILTASPAFAPQVARILAPGRWLTVADVEATLAAQAEVSPVARTEVT
jgi:energy-coupling factor transport system ATP-binding protein